MKKERDGRGRATVSPTTAAVVNGEISLEDWDDEELLYGRRRDKSGGFRGPKPKLLAAETVRELQRRRYSRAQAMLAHSLVDCVKLLRSIVNDESASRATRIKAAREIMNRVLGLPTERVSVDVFTEAPWRRAIAESIVPSLEAGGEIVDAEIVEEKPKRKTKGKKTRKKRPRMGK